MSEVLIWQLQLGATLAMTGVIWFVQLVHYPLFRLIDGEQFPRYAEAHSRHTTSVVAPLMLLEGVSAAWALAIATDWRAGLGFGLLVLIWLSTALVQVPCHERLRQRFDMAECDWLVRSNWARTAAWTGRSLLLLSAAPASLG